MTAPIDHPAGIEAAAARISQLARGVDPATPVPDLGRWKVRDVVAHLGGVHEWANRILTTRSMAGPGFRKSKLAGDELCDWFDAGAATLVETIRGIAEDDECPNFNPGSPPVAVWWFRRQLHETVVHRWDVEAAAKDTTPIDPIVAADGVDEFLDVFVRTRGKQTLTDTLVLAITDGPSWTLRPAKKPGRVDVEPGASTDAAARLTTDAESLLLALWGRQEPNTNQPNITGSKAVADSLFQ